MNPLPPPPAPESPGDVSIVSVEDTDAVLVDRRDLTALLVSTAIHLTVLLLLALWVLPTLVGDRDLVMEVSLGAAPTIALFDAIEITPTPDLPDEPEDEPELIEEIPVQPLADDAIAPTVAQASEPIVEFVNLESTPTAKSAASDSIEAAVDSITGDLEKRLEQDDLLVVWLLDASGSLVDDRKRVATRLEPFYQKLAADRDSSHELRSAVVSFGAQMRERIPPTQFGDRIVKAVDKVPVDRSGSERVFDAVGKCATHYRDIWNKQIVIVVWTDESGDDTAYLENTIAVCRKQKVSVSVVGPSSVLGADTGLHSYTDPKTNDRYQLPVKRGPDTPVAERLPLGYWYITRMGGFGRRFGGGLPAWIGGQDLEGVLSGFSPYALTRLTAQTGGRYTIFDRPEDRAPFDPVVMRRYAPTYESVDEYQDRISAHPLRRAVMNAVAELDGKKIDAPQTMFFTKKTGERFFDFMRYYYPPREFQAKLRNSRGRLIRQADNYSRIVERALEHLSKKDSLNQGLEQLAQSETSPRWRAWYDLTRGRLLATSVRLEEYRLTVNEMTQPGVLQPSTNHVVLQAASRKRSSGTFLDRAEEAEALLRRCTEEHAGTPWETLAQRELDYALGVGIRQMSLTPTPGAEMVRQPNLPRF